MLFEHRRPDKRRRVPPLMLQDLRQGLMRRLKNETARIPHLVHRRIQAGENARVGRGGERSIGDCVFKQDALSGELVQVRSFDFGIAIASQPVRAQGVDRHEQQVQIGPRRNTFATRGNFVVGGLTGGEE